MVETSWPCFPYWKMHQKIAIFVSARSQLYRRIFRFFLHFRLEHIPISPQKLKISAASTKKWWKIFTQNAKNAILTKIFDLEKKIYFFIFCNTELDLGLLWTESKAKLKNSSIQPRTSRHKIHENLWTFYWFWRRFSGSFSILTPNQEIHEGNGPIRSPPSSGLL